MNPRDHIWQIDLNKIGFLKVSDRASQLALNHMYKVKSGVAPSYLQDLFTGVSLRHEYNTRFSQSNYTVNRISGPTGGSFYHNATKHWNALPLEIKSSNSIETFKHKVKKHLANVAHSRETSDVYYY